MSDPAAAFDVAFRARAPRLGCRPETPQDRAFLIAQFIDCSPLARMMPPAMIEEQAAFQIAAHDHGFPDAMKRIATLAGRPVGRFMIDWTPANGHGVDLAVLAEARATGAGLAFLRAWTTVCDATGRTASLEVMADNPAALIYARLGFVAVAETEVDSPVVAMVRDPRSR